MDEATGIRDDFPENITVILKKIVESDVPDIDQFEYFVPPHQSIGQFVSMLKLGDQQQIYIFVKNKVTTHGTLMHEIYANHKDDDGKLYLSYSYSGEDILSAANSYLCITDSLLKEHPSGEKLFETAPQTLGHLLSTVEKLVSMTEAKENVELKKRLDKTLTRWKDAFCCILASGASKKDIAWVMKVKDHTDYAVRTHLALSLFPTGMLVAEDLKLQVEVSRQNLFKDSLMQVMATSTEQLHGGVSVFFEGEPAEGDGVLREWLFLVCSYLFDPKNNLFVASPNDPRRFSPHTSPPVDFDGLYQQAYRFSARIVCLALKLGVQVGILLDPLFFLLLGGKKTLSLKDLFQTDLELYNSYKNMLEMEAELFDSLEHGLTLDGIFENVHGIKVTSDNREYYVQCLIDRYYQKISNQVEQFSYGVKDMTEGVEADVFFSLLKIEDLDSMLRGSEEDDIDVNDWYQCTDYQGYQREDKVIDWFWTVVSEMNQEELRNLLCFWTSHRFLPRDGFRGLPRLLILKMYTNEGCLKENYMPTSQTCCYSLQLPEYNSYEHTKEKVLSITKHSGFDDV